MVALLMPFKPDSLEIDDASFVKYLEVGLIHVASQNFITASLTSFSVIMQHLWAGGIRNVVVNG